MARRRQSNGYAHSVTVTCPLIRKDRPQMMEFAADDETKLLPRQQWLRRAGFEAQGTDVPAEVRVTVEW